MAQHVQLLGSLGMIPSWQFNMNAAQNPNINSHVKFPEGWTQLTVQPHGHYRTSGDAGLQGLGRVRDHRTQRSSWTRAVARTGGGQCGPGCWPIKGGGCDCSGMVNRQMGGQLQVVGQGMRGLGTPMAAWAHKPAGVFKTSGQPQFAGIFDTTWWGQRKWLAFGLVGILGLGAAAIATKVLR
jgi:hypothetical protein